MSEQHKSLTPDERARIMADPNVQAILQDPRYSSPMLRDAAVNNYLSNDPRSPFRNIFGADANLRSDGVPAGGLHFDPVTGETQYTNTYGHPGTMRAVGLGAIGAAGGLAALGALPGLGSAGAAGGAAPMSAQQMYDAGMFAGPANMAGSNIAGTAMGVGGGVGGAAGYAANAAGAGAAGGIKGFLTNPGTYGGLAGLLTTLASRPQTPSNNINDLLSQNPQLASLLNMSVDRAQRTDPLHQAVTQLAMSRLPTNMQR